MASLLLLDVFLMHASGGYVRRKVTESIASVLPRHLQEAGDVLFVSRSRVNTRGPNAAAKDLASVPHTKTQRVTRCERARLQTCASVAVTVAVVLSLSDCRANNQSP
eukprot:3517369-Amphidinium_carterae.1